MGRCVGLGRADIDVFIAPIRCQILRQFFFRHTVGRQNTVDDLHIRMLRRQAGVWMGLHQHDPQPGFLITSA